MRPAVGDDVVHRRAAGRARPSASRTRRAADQRPVLQVEGRAAPPRPASRLSSPPRRASGSRRRSCSSRWNRLAGRRDHAAPARPPTSAKVVRSASWRRDDRVQARRSAARPARPPAAAAWGCGRLRCPGSSWSRNHSRCCAKESGSLGAGRGPRGIERRAPGRPRGRLDAPRASSASVGRLEESRAAAAPRREPARTRETTRVASSEWPPSSKKSSRTAHPLQPSTSRPDLRERLLGRACAAPRSRASADAAPSGAGSALRSTLPLAVSGSASSTHEGRRHHVLGQAARRGAPAARPRRTALVRGTHVRDQPPVAGRVLARQHHRLAHRRVLAQRAPRPRPARCGSRASSPGRRCGPGTRACRPRSQRTRSPVRYSRAPGSPERVGHEALGGQLRAGPGSRAPGPSPPTYSSPGTPTGTGWSRASST